MKTICSSVQEVEVRHYWHFQNFHQIWDLLKLRQSVCSSNCESLCFSLVKKLMTLEKMEDDVIKATLTVTGVVQELPFGVQGKDGIMWNAFVGNAIGRSVVRDEKLLCDGQLTLVVDLPVKLPSVSEGFRVLTKVVSQGPTLSDGISSLLTDSRHSDVTLVCGERSFRCHKAILAARSDVFDAMFRQEMSEAIGNTVVIDDIQPEVLEKMIQVMYSDKSDDIPDQLVQDLHQAVNKYMFPMLKAACERKMLLRIQIENAASILAFAISNDAEMLKSAALKFMDYHLTKVMATVAFTECMKVYPEVLKKLMEEEEW